MSDTHQRCAHCNGSFPGSYTDCPYCGRPAEPLSLLDRLLPRERGMTIAILGVATATFLLIGLLAGPAAFLAPSAYTLIHFGAMFPPYVLEGQVWRLVTALFLHGGLLHIGFNGWAFWSLGPLIEHSFGKSRMLAAFLLTGVASTLTSLLWGFVSLDVANAIPIPFLLDPDTVTGFGTPSVGMSGALTGLIGVGVAAGHRVKNQAGTLVRNRLLSWMGTIVLFGIFVPGIDNAAHIGGFLAGLPLGLLLPLKGAAGALGGRIWSIAGLAAALTILASLVFQGISIPRDYPPDVEGYPQAIFGAVLRSGDDDGPLRESWAACESAWHDLTFGDNDPDAPPDPDTVQRALDACDEANYLRPLEPAGYAWAAAAWHAHGDHDEACRRLNAGRLLLDYRFKKRADPRTRGLVMTTEQRFELVEERVKCR